MTLTANQRETNYVRQKLGPETEYPYGLRYLTRAQLRRIRHKMHRRQRRERESQ